MKTRLIYFFQNLQFQKKIVAITFLAGIFPLILLTIFSGGMIYHFAYERELSNTQDNLLAAYQQINLKLTAYEEALFFLTNNNQLIQNLFINNPSNYEQYDLYTNTVVPLFNSILSQHPDLLDITLYTSLDLNNHGQYVKNIEPDDITKNFEINRTINPSYYYDEESENIYLYSQLFTQGSNENNIIAFRISPNSLFEQLDSLSTELYTLSITNNDDQRLFQYSNILPVRKQDILNRFIHFFTDTTSNNQMELENSWMIELSRPLYSIYRSIVLLGFVTLLIFIFAILMLIASIGGLSRTIVSPLQALAKQMIDYPTKPSIIEPSYHSNDEIGQLYDSFHRMNLKIQELIDKVYKTEIDQQKHEIRALQAQINPHFFYNTLSLIYNKSVISGNKEISEMAQLLSKFYRLSLNSGKNKLSIKKELELTITYAKIQSKMHQGSFDVEVDIDEELLDYEIINLLIQPFVENAIFHGIDHIDDNRRGLLILRGLLLESHIQFEIIDNGQGMTQDKINNILTHQSENYGIKNVKQRISLYYGEENAITYESEINAGTKVRITLPKHSLK